METLTIGMFCFGLLLCLLCQQSILYALTAGLFLFTLYGLKKGYSFRTLLRFSMESVWTVRHILITFVLIGMMTALWREAGTIPVLVCYATQLIQPEYFLVMTFLLNCMISFLTGTAFGTAATMGVICSTMGVTMGISPLLLGGVILSGVYFGDRCSPVSTSALLVATLTHTELFSNLKAMMKTAAIPLAVTCVIYTVAGFWLQQSGAVPDLTAMFAQEFVLSIVAVVPAVVLMALSLGRVPVKQAMLASILAAMPLCLLVQHTAPEKLPHLLVSGFVAQNREVGAMMNGGGMLSMVRVGAIVCISSAYAGIFQKTGLLRGMQQKLEDLAAHTTGFTAMVVTSVITAMIACNQTLSIMLTEQLTRTLAVQKQDFAISLENSVVVISPLIPWSIAAAVPLASVGAPGQSVLFACFLYLVPLWQLVQSFLRQK